MGGLMGKPPKAPAPPPIPPVVAMPDPEDPLKKLAFAKSAAKKIKASGRASTDLVTKTDKMGGA